MKLDIKYQQARNSILMLKDVPTVSEAYGILLQEQTHQEISKGGHIPVSEEGIVCKADKRKYVDTKVANQEIKRLTPIFTVSIARSMVTPLIDVGKYMGIPQISSLTLGKRKIPPMEEQILL